METDAYGQCQFHGRAKAEGFSRQYEEECQQLSQKVHEYEQTEEGEWEQRYKKLERGILDLLEQR